MEEISEDEAESFEDKCTFLSSLHVMPDDFDIDSHNSDFDIVSPLTATKNSHNKPRLILDLRYVNSFVYKDKIKFDN